MCSRATRVQRLLKRRGLDPSDADVLQADPVAEDSPALAGISSASIHGRIALGPRAGARVWPVEGDPDAPWLLSTGPPARASRGLYLHANVAVPAEDCPNLEQLCRYLLRPAVAETGLYVIYAPTTPRGPITSRPDYSGWLRQMIKDAELADEVGAIERDAHLAPADSRRRVLDAIGERYAL